MDTASFRSKYVWNHLGFAGLDADEFNKRVTLVRLGIFTASAGTIYCLTYFWLGYSQLAFGAGSYISIYVVNLLVFILTKNYNVYRAIQPLLILLAPWVAHVTIGGFTDSSAVIVACFLSPVTALAFATRRTAHVYHGLFIFAIVSGGFWDIFYGADIPKVPKLIYSIFFIINIVSICSIIYFLIDGFLGKNKQLQEELRQSLDHLKATQAQLIQAEKMASMGELTAGVAHEIQNPLNFVNNFSELSVELLDELKEELMDKLPAGAKENVDDIFGNLTLNLQKISHHGKRADNIVKGMLEHSRISTGEKQPTDLNALADEYLRLAYHGLRAKDKSFNVELVTNFEPTLSKVDVVPQDIGRVLINLYNNAFYATQQKRNQEDNGYQPRVQVSTLVENGQVNVRVRDNGRGIPSEIVNKIYQPFFTTKPTGQGTGLGLSLSYDIIKKGHGGELRVDTKEGQFAEFTISLPLTKQKA